jgi:hypothetical protein
MEQTNNNAAKFAFFYMLSLVALIFMSLSSGMIIFQIINKYIIDILEQYRGRFNPDQLKFAISALVISTPIYYVTMQRIQKSLYQGDLDKDAGVRKWLTYFILFISSVVMIGWLIATLNSFLDGELTTKFILKAITAISIAAGIFTFYFYDIRREQVKEKKDRLVMVYFYASLLVVAAAFIGALIIVESPAETRNRKFDNAVLEDFSMIDGAINQYYSEYDKLPQDLDALMGEYTYITDKQLIDKATGEKHEYNIIGEREYELCAIFRTSNLEDETQRYYPYKDRWPHDSGKQCLKQKVREESELKEPVPLREVY